MVCRHTRSPNHPFISIHGLPHVYFEDGAAVQAELLSDNCGRQWGDIKRRKEQEEIQVATYHLLSCSL